MESTTASAARRGRRPVADGRRLGDYALEAELGRGAMGAVFRARSAKGELVAVKILSKQGVDARERFAREQRLHAAVSALEGFVPVLDSGAKDGVAFIVMPLLAGGTLRKRLDAGALEVAEAVELGVTLARALGRAHALGIVHR